MKTCESTKEAMKRETHKNASVSSTQMLNWASGIIALEKNAKHSQHDAKIMTVAELSDTKQKIIVSRTSENGETSQNIKKLK